MDGVRLRDCSRSAVPGHGGRRSECEWLTGRTQEADTEQAFDAGASVYVRKPFSPEDLNHAYRRCWSGMSFASSGRRALAA